MNNDNNEVNEKTLDTDETLTDANLDNKETEEMSAEESVQDEQAINEEAVIEDTTEDNNSQPEVESSGEEDVSDEAQEVNEEENTPTTEGGAFGTVETADLDEESEEGMEEHLGDLDKDEDSLEEDDTNEKAEEHEEGSDSEPIDIDNTTESENVEACEEGKENKDDEKEPENSDNTSEAIDITKKVLEEDKEIKEIYEKPLYKDSNYLLFGHEATPEYIKAKETLEYLKGLGYDNNPLKQARKSKELSIDLEKKIRETSINARYCDFCGAEISGVEFDVLDDGRERCQICSLTSVNTMDDFRRLLDEVKRNMETLFNIFISENVKIEVVNAKEIKKRCEKRSFIPSKEFDPRAVGVAIKDRKGLTILIENGSPRMKTILTFAHELTHIWQYINWDSKAIQNKYGTITLEIYEGMASWVATQYAYLINEPKTARTEEYTLARRDDEYGRGFLRYAANYPITEEAIIKGKTPFMFVDCPLKEAYCGNDIVNKYVTLNDELAQVVDKKK